MVAPKVEYDGTPMKIVISTKLIRKNWNFFCRKGFKRNCSFIPGRGHRPLFLAQEEHKEMVANNAAFNTCKGLCIHEMYAQRWKKKEKAEDGL